VGHVLGVVLVLFAARCNVVHAAALAGLGPGQLLRAGAHVQVGRFPVAVVAAAAGPLQSPAAGSAKEPPVDDDDADDEGGAGEHDAEHDDELVAVLDRGPTLRGRVQAGYPFLISPSEERFHAHGVLMTSVQVRNGEVAYSTRHAQVVHVYVPAALGDDLGFHDVHVRRLRVDVVAVEPPADVERVGIPSHHLFDPMCEESGV